MFTGYRTIIVNVLSFFAMLGEATEIINIIPDAHQATAAAILAAVNIGLRMMTTTPVGEKPNKA